MTDEERLKIWDCLELRHRLIFEIMYYTGLRISEVLRIKLNHISPIDKTLIVPRQKNKTIMNELIYIPKPLIMPLFSYLACYENTIKQNKNYVFYSKKRKGWHITLCGVSSLFWRARKQAGLDDCSVYKISKDGRKYRRISPHTHKNESIKAVYNKTGDLRAAQCQGHHTCMQSTQRYLGNPLTDTRLKKKNQHTWE